MKRARRTSSSCHVRRVALSKNVRNTTRYCKDGVWEESARGDKAVAYAFEDPDTAVLTRPPQA